MNEKLYFSAVWLNHLSILVPFFLFFYKNGSSIDRFKMLKYYLIISVAYEFITTFTEIYRIGDHWIVNIFYVLEFYLLSEYLFRLNGGEKYRRIIRAIHVIFAFLCLYFFVFQQDLFKVHDNVKSFTAIVLISQSIYFYYQLLYWANSPRLLADPYFWLVTAMFFFFTTTFIFSLYIREVLWAETDLARQIYFLILLVTILFRVLLAVSFLNTQKEKK